MAIVLRRALFITLTVIAALPLAAALRMPSAERSGQVPQDIDEPAIAAAPRFVVEVVGRDFRWHFRKLEPEVGPFNVNRARTIEELRLPVGASVEFRLASEDFVYRCSVPELGLEEIAVPGLVRPCFFQAAEPATIDLIVEPLCGFRFYHDELMGRIIISEDVRFIQPRGST